MEETKPLSGLQDNVQAEPKYVRTFTDDEAADINTITLLRIYDMLGAILTQQDAILKKLSGAENNNQDLADFVLDEHTNGKLVGPFPALNI